MMKFSLPLPEIVAIAATRGILGMGVGLLLADQIRKRTRKTLGCALFTIGALSTIPLALDVARRYQKNDDGESAGE